MHIAESKMPTHLAHHGVIKLPDASGLQIECFVGSLWITLDGDPCDFVMEPGQCFVTDQHRPVTVSALEASELRVLLRADSTAGRSLHPLRLTRDSVSSPARPTCSGGPGGLPCASHTPPRRR